jgi:hypothetical protein
MHPLSGSAPPVHTPASHRGVVAVLARDGDNDERGDMRRTIVIVLALLALGAGVAVGADHSRNDKTFQYAVGLWGDLPYSDAQAAKIPDLLADMNNQELAFSVNDGDLKQGSGSPCDDALYLQAKGWLSSLDAPAMFTPGDNDWTDCDRASNGGYDSLERLDRERQIFFSTNRSLGRHPLRQDVQTDPTCLNHLRKPAPCVENRRWTYQDVTYATLNVQGSCNNLCDTNPDPAEFAARNQADIAWLTQTFAEAQREHAVAIMFISQADPGFDQSDPTRAPLRNPQTLAETDGQPDGFVDFLRALRMLTIQFGKPVAYVHGDSHYFRVDHPLLDSLGRRVQNFTRVETFGDNQTPAGNTNDVQWLKALVDPHSRDVFAFQPQIIPGNWTATP